MATDIIAQPISFSTSIEGGYNIDVAAPLNPLLNVVFNCAGYDKNGDPYQGYLFYSYGGDYDLGGTFIDADTLSYSYDIDHDRVVVSYVHACDEFVYSYDFNLGAYSDTVDGIHIVKSTAGIKNIQWSKIGSFDFTVDETNMAGYRPASWTGDIYSIKRFKNSVIVYGENGIAKMIPIGTSWSYEDIYFKGIAGKNAVVTDKENHWFINTDYELIHYNEEFTNFGYSEFLSTMASPVMTLDTNSNLIYICNGTYGYVFSYASICLAAGPVNISGIGYKDKVRYVCSPGSISTPNIYFITDVYDMGSRRTKLLHSLELGVSSTKTLSMSIDYRYDSTESWENTGWLAANDDGIINYPCLGVEFRFNFKVDEYEEFAIDYIKIHGVMHSFSYIDEYVLEQIGCVYDIRKINDNVMVYGEKGITLLTHDGNSDIWRQIHTLKKGTKGKNAQIGNDTAHWFVSTDGELYQVNDTIVNLGYEEFLSALENPVLSLDEVNNFVYICDGIYGFVYSFNDKSLCKGPPNITGYRTQEGITYCCADGIIVQPSVEFVTNNYDFGSRKEKTIMTVEIGMENPDNLEIAIEYKNKELESYNSSPWVQFTPQGIAYLPCYGREFRFKFRAMRMMYMAIDSIKVNGVIHGFSYLDMRSAN